MSYFFIKMRFRFQKSSRKIAKTLYTDLTGRSTTMKKILIKLTVGLALSISWIAIYQATIHAATMTNPKITTVQQYTPKQALVTKSQSNNYLWNASHTKKIANLKNYSKTTFYASRLVSMRFPHYQYSVNYY